MCPYCGGEVIKLANGTQDLRGSSPVRAVAVYLKSPAALGRRSQGRCMEDLWKISRGRRAGRIFCCRHAGTGQQIVQTMAQFPEARLMDQCEVLGEEKTRVQGVGKCLLVEEQDIEQDAATTPDPDFLGKFSDESC